MNTYQTVCDELQCLRGQVATEQAALADLSAEYDRLCRASVDDPEVALEAATLPTQREMIKARIHGLEMRISEKETAQTSLENAAFSESQRAREETERAAKLKLWRALNSQCAAARKEMEGTVEPLRAAQANVDEQAGKIQQARDALSHHLETKPRFRLDEELAAWNSTLTKLEAAVRNAFAEMRRLDDIRTCVAQRQTQSRNEFERLAFQVRMAQPPEEPLPTSQLTAR